MNKLEIEESNLVNIERLLAHSMKGIHCLFDNESVAKILQKPTEEIDFFRLENMDRIQKLFSDFIAKRSVPEKLQYLETLKAEEYEILVRTYFHILDNSIMASADLKH